MGGAKKTSHENDIKGKTFIQTIYTP